MPKLRHDQHAHRVPPSTSGSLRLAVPMPALKSQVIIPVPPPTLPSGTGPSLAVRSPRVTCSSCTWRAGDVVQPGVVALAHERDDDVVLVPDARVALDHPLHAPRPTRRRPTSCW